MLLALTVVWMVVLVYVSVRPTLPEVGAGAFTATASMEHVAAYGLLGLLMYGTLASLGRARRHVLAGWAVATLLAFLWGGFNEMLQAFVPERVPEWKDVLFNGVGAAAGAMGIAVGLHWRRARTRHL